MLTRLQRLHRVFISAGLLLLLIAINLCQAPRR